MDNKINGVWFREVPKTMKKTVVVLSIGIAALAFTARAAEEVVEMEARTDTAQEGMYLLIVSKPLAKNSPMGDAFMVLANGESLAALEVEIAYGMRLGRGGVTLAEMSAEDVAAVRASESGQPARVWAVRIDQAQHDKLEDLFGEWILIEEFDILLSNAILDVTQEALKIIGYKRSYRSGLMSPHVMNYYLDIATINRKHKV